MSTLIRGSFVEATALQAFVRLGYPVLAPFSDGLPYDLVVDLGEGVFLRVQCKSGRLKTGCLEFNSRCTDHGKGRLPYAGLADVFAVVGPVDETVYVLPVLDCLGYVTRIRLRPTRNNQQVGVRHAADFVLDAWSCQALRDTAVNGGSRRQDLTLLTY